MAERTESDKKGGHLAIRKSDGRYLLRESAMCLDEDKAAFEDISKHKFFNTNNLWINLPKLKTVLEAVSTVAPDLLSSWIMSYSKNQASVSYQYSCF